jgi:hypothetical protein
MKRPALAYIIAYLPIVIILYFLPGWCLREMTLALARGAQKPDFILPLLRTARPIPAGHEHIQYIDRAREDFIGRLVARCREG